MAEKIHVNPSKIGNLFKKQDTQQVPNSRVNYLNPKVVQKGWLTKSQLKHLSNRSLIKQVPGFQVQHLNPKFITQGQISIKACCWLKDNRSKLWHSLPDLAKHAGKHFQKKGSLRFSAKEKQYYKEFYTKRCIHSARKFRSSGETRPVVSYSAERKRKALFFTCLPISDYNYAFYDKSKKLRTSLMRQLETVSCSFDFEHYQVGTVSEIAEVCNDSRLIGKVELLVFSGHGESDSISLSEDPKAKQCKPEESLSIDKSSSNTAKRIYPLLRNILTPKNSFVVFNGCNTATLQRGMCMTKKFARCLATIRTSVIGFSAEVFNKNIAITSLILGKISYSMAAQDGNKNTQEAVRIYQI